MADMLEINIEAMVQTEIAAAGIPGCSGAIVGLSGRHQAFAVGLADVAGQRKVTPATVFHLYSGTKIFTATAIMQLVDRGAILLDQPVHDLLPDTLADRFITIRHLLSQQSGLDDTLSAILAVHLADEPPVDTAAALSRFKIHSSKPAGRQVAYRNVNYAMLGEIVTRVTGRPFVDAVTASILAPLAMDATFTTTAAMSANAATGYAGAWGPLFLSAPFLIPRHGAHIFGQRTGGLRALKPFDLDCAAIGGLVGTASAFVPFLRLHLEGNAKLLSEDCRLAMQALVAEGAAGIASRAGMGLGWKIGSAADGTRFLNHEGGGPGFTSELRLYPDAGTGIVLMMNRWLPPSRSHMAAHAICEKIRLGRA